MTVDEPDLTVRPTLFLLLGLVLAAVAAIVIVLQPPHHPAAGPPVLPSTTQSANPSVDPQSGLPVDPPSSVPSLPVGVQLPLPIRVAQANLRMGMPQRQFRADVREVLGDRPDFVTYNEVGLRQVGYLGPAGYQVFRTPGRYTGEAAVAWRSQKWRALARGTVMVSNRAGRLAWQRHPWGIRFANWVMVAARDGQRISVVSVHTAPLTRITRGILDPSLIRVGRLVRRLASYGPVIVAGDLNVAYASSHFPRALLARFGLTATYDLTGRSLPTGDHHGSTIDYVLVDRADRFAVTRQAIRRLHSDHNALVVDLLLMPAATH